MNGYEEAYGKSFSRFNREKIDGVVKNLQERFTINNINPKSIFDGNNCLDAGCGAGRGSIMMSLNGAKHIDCLDISNLNIKTTQKNLNKYNVKSFSVKQASIEEIPYPDEFFDVVWCYGVVHHTSNPDKSLTELVRVLKTGGKLCIFLYGAGGILRYLVSRARRRTLLIDPAICRSVIENLETNLHAALMDNWVAPHVRVYEAEKVSLRLSELGIEKTAVKIWN